MACVNFLFKAEQYCTVYKCHVLLTHSPVDGHTGCVYLLAVGTNAGMDIDVHASLRSLCAVLLVLYLEPELDLLDHMIPLYNILYIYVLCNSIVIVLGTTILFPIAHVPWDFPISSTQELEFLHILLYLLLLRAVLFYLLAVIPMGVKCELHGDLSCSSFKTPLRRTNQNVIRCKYSTVNVCKIFSFFPKITAPPRMNGCSKNSSELGVKRPVSNTFQGGL